MHRTADFSQHRYAYSLALSIMVLFGALDILKGVSAPLMQQDWHLSYLQVGNIFVSNSLGYLAGSFLAGSFVQRFGTKIMLLSGGGTLAVSLLFTVLLQSYTGLLFAFLLGGIGSGWLEIGVNHVVPEMTEDPHLQSKYFNWLHGLYGVGAVIFPAVAAFLIRRTHQWRVSYEVSLILLMMILLASLFLNMRRITTVSTREKGLEQEQTAVRETTKWKKGAIFRSPILYGLILAISLYVMAEIGVGSWLTTYLVRVESFSVSTASYVLSAFYFTFTLGRLTAHLWVPRTGNERSILVSAIFAAVVFSIAITNRQTAVIGFSLAGLGFAIIFPTITAVASYRFKEQSGRVLGILFTAAGIGSLLVNWLVGLIATGFGMKAGLGMVILFLLLVFVVMLWVRRRIISADSTDREAT
ncbi:sugar MFS transporter [Alicyclobacillus sp. SO9]|uniref:MFS transporter n=1 Tax=Alicyclobacillus sp. SO9 TaxID=2665646 RepID=UPI0018E7F85E|nr:MFS transporter [Alicyclobacillus sp. SO9]QQE79946.1 MFS transporter [Alicyclobacillus sp. SO9]